MVIGHQQIDRDNLRKVRILAKVQRRRKRKTN